MITSRSRRALLAGLAAAGVSSLAACSLGRPAPPVTTYSIEPAPPARALPLEARQAPALRIGPVRVAASYSGAELVYRLDEARFASDFYHRLLASPGAVLGNSIANWLETAGPMRVVLPPGSAMATRYLLDVSVSQLYGDFRPGRPPVAVLRLQVALLDTQAPTPLPVFELSFDEREPLAETSPEALVLGYAAAMRRVLEALQPQLARALR